MSALALPPHGHDADVEALPALEYFASSNNEYSSPDEDSMDEDAEELATIINDDELMARIRGNSLRSKRRPDKRHHSTVRFVNAVNADQDAEHQACV